MPEDITHVVFTHVHPDHIRGLFNDFDEPLFCQRHRSDGPDRVVILAEPCDRRHHWRGARGLCRGRQAPEAGDRGQCGAV
ncbi:hypothetical protein [Tateyamaria omphalii]|uniref:hypothetical protein n=1 Tax=Tateyamaria omphalii TaxID=299262 RepID=UPI0020C7F512|nr:hypothetical protein [Tateyamaria omphalii]